MSTTIYKMKFQFINTKSLIWLRLEVATSYNQQCLIISPYISGGQCRASSHRRKEAPPERCHDNN